ncbi:MAG: PAS domain S-box protein [Smithellaceae bacterium]
MTKKDPTDPVSQILDILATALAEGNYAARMDAASMDGPLGEVAQAINRLFDKTERRFGALSQFVENQAADARRYRNMIDALEESYFEVDLKGNLLFFNERVILDLGYTDTELQGMNFHEFLDDANQKKVYEAFHQVFLTGQPVKGFDWTITRKNGSKIDVESSVALLRDGQDRPFGFRGVVRDVTARNKAQQALRASEEKYRNILENMEETYLETDLRGDFIFFNDALSKMLGYSRTELYHMNYRDCVEEHAVADIFKRFNHIYLTNEPKTLITHELIAKNGSKKIVEMSVSLRRDPTGAPAGFRGIARDVTEKLQSEQAAKASARHLRLINDNIDDIIWTADFDLRWTYLSPSVFTMTGFTPEEIMGIPLRVMLPPETFDMIQSTLQEELAKENVLVSPAREKSATFEMELLRKNGTRLWVEISANFNRDEKGIPFEIVGVTRDITERKNTEEKMKEREKRYRMMTENVNDIVWVIDFGMRLSYVSESTALITGFSVEESRNMFLEDLLTPESFALAAKALAEELATENTNPLANPNRSRTLEIEAYSKSGNNVWLEVNATFNRDENGQATEVLAVGRNITLRRQIERDLAESEKRYRLLLENMHDAIWTMDFNFQYIYLSPAIEQLTGYTPDEIRKIPLDRQLTAESMAVVEKVILEEFEAGEPLRPKNPDISRVLELEVLRKDGSRLWQELTLSFNRDDQGKPFELLGVARDITERKKAQALIEESENRYRMIVENIHEIIWTTDLDMRNTYVSPSCFHLTGYTPDELMVLPPDQLTTLESFTLAANIVAEEISREFSGEPVDPHRTRTLEQEIICKAGNTVWLEVTATFIRDKQGKAKGMLMAGRDITARKSAEEEKTKLEKQLVQAQKLEIVGRLAGGVAHDFNNMLSVILGYVDLVKLKLGRQHPIIKDITEIEKAAIRSRDITTQLLAFSRKQIIAPKIVDLNELVTNSQKALMRLIGEDVRLSYHPATNLWPIKIDPSQVEQILINLAVNSRDAMPAGGTLSIATANVTLDGSYCEQHAGATPGHYIRLSVSDSGTGMDKKTLQHIFEPFFTTKETGKGTGLGLATVYGIVNQNNGFINVYSEPSRGSTFTIFLPRTQEVPSSPAVAEEETILAATGNILLVEDDAMVLKITRGMLESIGYHVLAAENPVDALSLYEAHPASIDLIITDVIMPTMSGKEMRDRLVAKHPDIRVLFMSGYTADVIVHHGVLDEGVKFLQKPFTLKDLATKVREMMTDK